MLASYNLLKKFVDLNGISPKEIADKLTFAGLEVEGLEKMADADNLVIGQIKSVENHPDSDHLHVLMVDEGDKYGVNQIVCGAPNVRVGLKVIVARVGASLPAKGIVITKSTIRGVDSNGMCCALNELGVKKEYLTEKQINGIEELNDDAPVGEENVLNYLGLDDVVFDINVLANRSDCLAIFSIAKELSSLFNRKLMIDSPRKFKELKSPLTVKSSTEDCPQFSVKLIKGVKTKPSPKWLSSYLMSEGIRSINNIVDIGNYVMILTGQPLHMYDYDKLGGNDYDVRNDYEGDLVALDDKTYSVKCGDLLVFNHNNPVCLAGTMGLKSVAIDEGTKDIVIEAANFKGSTVRQTGNRLGLSSESSARFVKGINPYQDEFVLSLTTELLVSLADAKEVYEISRYSILGENKTKIETSISYINNRLGTSFTKEQIIDTLVKLHNRVEMIDNDRFIDYPPDYRIDIKCDADLSEEVIRFIGFDAIKSSLPQMVTTTGGYTPSQSKRLSIREYLIDQGLNETLTFTLVSPKLDNEFVLLASGDPYLIVNPMTVDHSVTRRGIVSSLLNVIEYNLNHQQSDLGFFEISRVETKTESFEELAIVLNGNKSIRGSLSKRPFDFYDIHGYLEGIFKILGIEANRYKEIRLLDSPFYHPGRSVSIYMGKDLVGVIGQVHPLKSKDLGDTYVLDINLTKLLETRVSPIKMKQISKFPSVSRDLAFVVNDNIMAGDMIKSIKKNGKSLVKDVKIFDVYVGQFLLPGTKSIAFTITYQDDEKTLKEQEINDAEQNIISSLVKEFNAVLRG